MISEAQIIPSKRKGNRKLIRLSYKSYKNRRYLTQFSN